jgi:hypothetical protein
VSPKEVGQAGFNRIEIWRSNRDGIQLGELVSIRDSFFKPLLSDHSSYPWDPVNPVWEIFSCFLSFACLAVALAKAGVFVINNPV